MSEKTLAIRLRMYADGVKSAVSGTIADMGRLGRSLNQAGQGMRRVGRAALIGATIPIVGLGIASVSAATEAEEISNKYGVVFSQVSRDADAMAQNLRDNYGLAKSSAQDMLSGTGDLLSGFGFAQEASLDLSSQVQTLSVDLASFTNYEGGAKGASEALTKALLGERESVKSLGITILEEDVKAQVAVNRAAGRVYATERQAKAYATLDIAMRQSKNAIGDWARSADSKANRMRVLMARTRELRESIGVMISDTLRLADVYGWVAGRVEALTGWIDKMSPGMRKTVVVMAAMAAAAGPVLIVLGGLVSGVGLAMSGFAAMPALFGFIGAALPVVLAVTAAVAGVGFALVQIIGRGDTFKERMVDAFSKTLDAGKRTLGWLKDTWDEYGSIVIQTAQLTWIEIDSAFQQYWRAGEVFLFNMVAGFKNLRENFGTLLDWFGKNWFELFRNMPKIAKNAIALIRSEFTGDDSGTLAGMQKALLNRGTRELAALDAAKASGQIGTDAYRAATEQLRQRMAAERRRLKDEYGQGGLLGGTGIKGPEITQVAEYRSWTNESLEIDRDRLRRREEVLKGSAQKAGEAAISAVDKTAKSAAKTAGEETAKAINGVRFAGAALLGSREAYSARMEHQYRASGSVTVRGAGESVTTTSGSPEDRDRKTIIGHLGDIARAVERMDISMDGNVVLGIV
ncbi:MAG: hypothetical protein RRC34_02915 [Lentisphaeria bacterium]|nr:hypothetical protein [Lentisphaeria bacterium]